MFLLFLDESTHWPKKVIGAVSILKDDFIKFEAEYIRLRLDEKVFGELKWEKVGNEGKYFNFYLYSIKKLFSFNSVRFHSYEYSGDKYRAAYALIRSISWKLQRIKHSGPLGILFDEYGDTGKREIEKSKECFKNDAAFNHSLSFYTQTKSALFTILQMTDIITGAMAYRVNKDHHKLSNPIKNKFVKHLESLDKNEDLSLCSPQGLWPYNSKKIQHHNLDIKK
jgi:hypothetical protein